MTTKISIHRVEDVTAHGVEKSDQTGTYWVTLDIKTDTGVTSLTLFCANGEEGGRLARSLHEALRESEDA